MTRRFLLIGCIVLFAAANAFVATAAPRKLKVIKSLDLTKLSSQKTQYYLKGAVISQTYQVDTTNGAIDLATVSPLTLGELTFAPGSYGITTSPDYIPVTGTLNAYSLVLGKYKVTKYKGDLAVAGAVRPDLRVRYRVDVGIARRWGKKGVFDIKDTVLTGVVTSKGSAGHASNMLVTLASKLPERGTLASDTQIATQVDSRGRNNLRGLYRSVGSEAEIYAAGAGAAGDTLSMEWRARTKAEAYSPRATTLPDPDLPAGAKWLTSDVVKIGGLESGVSYALQMTFDNRINMSLDGPINGTIAEELAGLYIAQRANANDTGLWANAAQMGTPGAQAQERVFQSLSAFLAANSAYTLAELQGSWGVDPTSADQGTGRSWAIVAGGGSGIFAVVPEPSTLVLIGISAGIGLMAYGLRRRKSKVVA